MSVRGILESLSEEASASVLAIVKRAYEIGYREGLAARAAVAGALPSQEGEHALVGDAAHAPTLSRPAPVAFPEDDADDVVDAVYEEDADEPEDEDDGDEQGGPDDAEPSGEGDPVAPAVRWARSPREDAERRPPEHMAKPIHAATTVGRLKHRIFRVFGLERFDIDVIICRKGDRDRRQLKSNVRLSKYFVDR